MPKFNADKSSNPGENVKFSIDLGQHHGLQPFILLYLISWVSNIFMAEPHQLVWVDSCSRTWKNNKWYIKLHKLL